MERNVNLVYTGYECTLSYLFLLLKGRKGGSTTGCNINLWEARMQIAELKAHVGEEAEITVFLSDANESANRFSNRWIDLVVSDRTGSTTIKMWAEAISENINPMELIGHVVVATGQIDLWQDRGGMNVVNIRKAEEGAYKKSDLFRSISEEETVYLKDKLESLIREVKDEVLHSLLSAIFIPSRISKMVDKCGGTSHHTYLGGLLAHTVQTAELAKAAAKLYGAAGPYRRHLNIDHVIAGALLHDVGKLTTLSDEPGKLSERGFNIDSATESVLYATTYNSQLEKKLENLAPIDHIILACRDAKPRSLEAIIVRNADTMSNQMDAYGLAFSGNTTKRGGMISYSKELGAYMLKGEDR